MKKRILILSAVISALALNSVTVFAADTSASVNKSWNNFFEYLKNCPIALILAAISAGIVLALLIFSKPLAKKLNNSSGSQMVNAFIAFFTICGIGCFAMALVSDGVTWGHLLHSDNTSTGETFHFYDFLNTLRDAGSKKFSKSAANFSPMSLLIFYILAQFMPTRYIYSISLVELLNMTRNQTFIYLYLILVIFCIVLIYRMNRNVLRHNELRMRDEVVAFLLVVSYPTMYCIKMGNIMGLSLALGMFFFVFRANEKRAMRELSLIALALSAAITPYTLIFALLLITKSKDSIVDFVKTVTYSAVLFVVPAFFTGFENMAIYLKNLFTVSDICEIENLTISNFLRFADIRSDVLIYIVSAVFEVAAIACIFILPSVWQKAAAAVYCIINLVPAEDNIILIFVFIPLIFLLAEKKHKTADWLYLAAFSLLVAPIPEWFYYDRTDMISMFESIELFSLHNANEIIAPLAVQMIFILIVCQSVSVIINNKKKTAVAETQTAAE